MKTETKHFIKSTLLGLVYFIFLVSLCLNIASFIITGDLTSKLMQKEKYIYKQTVNLKLTSTLSNRTWYIVNDSTVSSKEDGKGQVVDLHDKLKPEWSRYGRRDLNKNGYITFYPISHDVPYNNLDAVLAYTLIKYQPEN